MNERGDQEAFASCVEQARSHYENFPVVSRLLPRKTGRYIAAIYVFARSADDYADEGETPLVERLRALDLHEEKLDRALRGEADDLNFHALSVTLRETGIPEQLLRDLLSAFRQDARNNGYGTLEELLDYCTRSANPIGRLLLHLYGTPTEEQLRLSDEVCTGLQLVNFWQDLSIDIPRDRITPPKSVLDHHGITVEELEKGEESEEFLGMMRELTDLAEDYLLRGSHLPSIIPDRRLRFQLRGTVLGGLKIAEKIRGLDYRLLRKRPVIRKVDLPGLLWGSLFYRTRP